jgi:hypothetical protein
LIKNNNNLFSAYLSSLKKLRLSMPRSNKRSLMVITSFDLFVRFVSASIVVEGEEEEEEEEEEDDDDEEEDDDDEDPSSADNMFELSRFLKNFPNDFSACKIWFIYLILSKSLHEPSSTKLCYKILTLCFFP